MRRLGGRGAVAAPVPRSCFSLRRRFVVVRRRRSQKERFSALHASLQSFRTRQTDVGVSTGQHYGRTVAAIELVEADHAVKGHDRSGGRRDLDSRTHLHGGIDVYVVNSAKTFLAFTRFFPSVRSRCCT